MKLFQWLCVYCIPQMSAIHGMDALAELMEKYRKTKVQEAALKKPMVLGAVPSKPINIPRKTVTSAPRKPVVFIHHKQPAQPIPCSPPPSTVTSPSLSPYMPSKTLRLSSTSTSESSGNVTPQQSPSVPDNRKEAELKQLRELITQTRGFRDAAQKKLVIDPENQSIRNEMYLWEEVLRSHAKKVYELIKP